MIEIKSFMKNFLTAKWQQLIMANYIVPEQILLPYLPKGLELNLYNGKAYVSLVGFLFKDIKIARIPILGLGTFEEINLRFYVKRSIDKDSLQHGVVFINETIPYKPVAWLANRLFNEHYTVVKTKHAWHFNNNKKEITYQWKKEKTWNSIQIKSDTQSKKIEVGSFESFIFDNYIGFTKISDQVSQSYYIEHPSWEVNDVHSFNILCDFKTMYGPEFSFLTDQNPDTVFIAEGSPIAVKWKRDLIKD